MSNVEKSNSKLYIKTKRQQGMHVEGSVFGICAVGQQESGIYGKSNARAKGYNCGIRGEGPTGVIGIATIGGPWTPFAGRDINGNEVGILGIGYTAGISGEGKKYGITGNGQVTGILAKGKNADFKAAESGMYIPFTGAHEVIINKNLMRTIKPGMLLVTTGKVGKRVNDKKEINISSTLPEVVLTNQPNDKNMFGVYTSPCEDDEHWYSLKKNETLALANAVGEGRALVCTINGEIEQGDYLTTSEIPGYAMRQDDDVLHNYTLGKVTEALEWSTVKDTIQHNGKEYKYYLIAVVYMCG